MRPSQAKRLFSAFLSLWMILASLGQTWAMVPPPEVESEVAPSPAGPAELPQEGEPESEPPSELTTSSPEALSSASVLPEFGTLPPGSGGEVAPDATVSEEPVYGGTALASLPLTAPAGVEANLPPTTLTVNNPSATVNGDTQSIETLQENDGGDGVSFVEALEAINNTGSGHTIQFALFKGATITLDRTVYLRASNTTIDGDQDNDGTPDIVLVPPSAGTMSLSVISDNNVIKRLVISGLSLRTANAHHNRVEGCYLGTDITGKVASSRAGVGVELGLGAHDNTIGGSTPAQRNIIAGNSSHPKMPAAGVSLFYGAHQNNVVGNYIGLGVDGNQLANQIGIVIWDGALDSTATQNTYGNVVGGSRPGTTCSGPCNVISGNTMIGISLKGVKTYDNLIQGNYVGVSPGGTSAVDNGYSGVVLQGGAKQNTIGGERTGSNCDGVCNVISGNMQAGVALEGAGTSNNVVSGNYIGLDGAGANAIDNAYSGVIIEQGATGNRVGGSRPAVGCTGPCNVISGNSEAGIALLGSNTANNKVQGNYIGLNPTGNDAFSNLKSGVGIQTSASGNEVGGKRESLSVCQGHCNVISGNAMQGVMIEGAPGNMVQGNYIGTDAQGSVGTLGNQLSGVLIKNASTNLIGGTERAHGNWIAGNKAGGVALHRTSEATSQNTIRFNEMASNNGPNIDLVPGVGTGVEDNGPNESLDPPALLPQQTMNGSVVLRGTADIADGSTIDIYEKGGHKHLGSTTVSAKAFTLVLPEGVIVTEPVLATVTNPAGSTSELSAYGQLWLSAPNALPGGRVYAFGVITQTWNSTSVTASDHVTLTVDGKDYKLSNDGQNTDYFRDTYFTAWFTAPTTIGDYAVQMKLNDVPAAATVLQVSTTPQLAIMTDIQALKEEFVRTSGTAASQMYEPLKALSTYAGRYQGVLLDVRQEIKQAGFYGTTPYANYSYLTGGTAHRTSMAKAIDRYIAGLATYRSTLKYLAIIGDDAVIPLFRRADPVAAWCTDTNPKTHCEAHYPGQVSGAKGNPTLIDSASPATVLTDLPYASFDARDPNTVSRPKPDLAVARLFHRLPLELKEGIEAYQTPIDLRRTQVGSGLSLQNENPGPTWEENFDSGIVSPVETRFLVHLVPTGTLAVPSPLQPGRFYHFDGALNAWTSFSILNAIQNTRLIAIYSHADQFQQTAQAGASLKATQLRLLSKAPGTLVINAGCHSGYPVSRAPAPATDYMSTSFSTVALERQLTYVAPTVYGLGRNNDLQYHDRLFRVFLSQALHGSAKTVGQALLYAQRGYEVQVSNAPPNLVDTYVRYGTILYGLPTQCFEGRCPTTGGGGAAPEPMAPQGGAAVAVQRTLPVVIETPHFEQVTNPDGTTRFELVNTGGASGAAGYPILPQVSRSYWLPAGSTVSNVNLLGQQSSQHPLSVTLELAVPFHRTSGPIEMSVPLTTTYPADNYWHGTADMDDRILLYVGVNPVQYDPATSLVTLTTWLTLEVAFEVPAAGASVTQLLVNNGDPVSTGQATLPIRLDVQSSSAHTTTLEWMIDDAAGNTLHREAGEFYLEAGPNLVALTADTLGWHPGPMLLTVLVGDGEEVTEAAYTSFVAEGHSLAADTDQDFYSTELTATVSAAVHDQDGAGVAGLSGTLTATLDSTPVAIFFTEVATGHYTGTLSISGLAEGSHVLVVGLPDIPHATTTLNVDTTPPTATVETLPDVVTDLSIPVRWIGSDGGGIGIDYYEIQYAVNSTATWTTWLTASAELDYLEAYRTAFFGPWSPVTVAFGDELYFRVRAVDLLGNQGAFLGGDGDAWTLMAINPPQQRPEAVARVIELTNEQRALYGLPPLKVVEALNRSAQGHSLDMAQNSFLSHTGSDGSSHSDRIYRQGYEGLIELENVAGGQQTPEAVIAAWMGSTGHRENILDPDIREIGVGYAYNPTGHGDLYHLWTQNLSARHLVYPVVINGEAEVTTSSAVTLTLYGENWAVDMMISNDPAFTGASWQPFTTTVPWALTGGDGSNSVYVQLRDGSGTVLQNSDEIILNCCTVRGADLELFKGDEPDPVAVGDLLTYTLVVTNHGPVAASGVHLVDALPAGVDLVGSRISQGFCSPAAGVVTCAVGEIRPGETITGLLHVVPTLAAGGVLTNQVVVRQYEYDPDTTSDTYTATTSVRGGRADLSVFKDDQVDPTQVGGSLVYSITVHNAGPAPVGSVLLTDTLPTGVLYAAHQAGQGSCVESAGELHCSLGTVAAASSVTVTLVVTPSAAGAITNTVRVASTDDLVDPELGNNLALEETLVTTLLVVNTTGDGIDGSPGDGVCDVGGGECTLRAAILESNAHGGLDTIAFDIPGAGPHTIQPGGALPTVTDPVLLDATTEPDYDGTPAVELDGSGAGGMVDGLAITAGGSTVRGLAVNRFGGNGLVLRTLGGNQVDSCFIGTDITGTAASANGGSGILIDDSPDNLIVDNLLSGNTGDGLFIVGSGATGNQVRHNLIGTDILGAAALGNGDDGVDIFQATDNTVGGGNLISGNGDDGVELSGYGGAHSNLVEGNRIGTNISGTAALGNTYAGVFVTDASTNTLQSNLISGNMRGVHITGSDAYGNRVQSNKIGTDLSGTAAVGNTDYGVHIESASNNLIGGSSASLGNLISGNQGDGIFVEYNASVGNVIQSNRIGTDVTGMFQLGNFGDGVRLGTSTSDGGGRLWQSGGWEHQLLDNLISGNGNAGVLVACFDCLLEGNTIGTDLDGTAAIGNAAMGVYVSGVTGAVVQRNLVSANGAAGIVIDTYYHSPASNNEILGNMIGTDSAGAAALGNTGHGVVIAGDDNTVGPTVEGEGNLISANGGDGIAIGGSMGLAFRNQVVGNLIGTDGTGTLALGNGGDGVSVCCGDNLVGGTDPDSGNVIAASGDDGVHMSAMWGGNKVQGNAIGTDASGTLDLGNTDHGVEVNGVPEALIGGVEPTAGNAIAFNGGAGVVVDFSGLEVAIQSNAIYSNTGLGIDLAADGVTANDPGDSDSGENNLQNTPVLTLAAHGSTVVEGTLDSAPDTTFQIAFYGNSTCDPSGYGEGRQPLGEIQVATDGTGQASFTAHLTPTMPLGGSVTATAADPDGNTSEFSACATVVEEADLEVTKTDDTEPVLVGTHLTYTLVVTNLGPTSASGVVLTDTLPAGVELASASAGAGSCGHSGRVVTCTLGALASNAAANVSLVVTATAPGNWTNQASVSAGEPDPYPENNSVSQTTAVDPADLWVAKTDGPDPVMVGEPLAYTVTVHNRGPLVATGVIITDILASAIIGGPVEPSQGGCFEDGYLICTLGQVDSGATATITLIVTPTLPGVITNTVLASADQGDPDMRDNVAHQATVVSPADLTLTKEASVSGVAAGLPISYTLVLLNQGPAVAHGVQLTDSLPLSLTYASSTTSQGSCSGGPLVTCDLGTVDVGGSVTVTLAVTVTSVGTITNTALVRADEPDTDPADNTAAAVVSSGTAVDLAVAQWATPDPAWYEQPLTYNIVVTNSGPLPATGVTITDTLPGEVWIADASPPGVCTYLAGVVTCDLGSAPVGAAVTVTLVVTPVSFPAGLDPILVNRVQAGADQTDSEQEDNEAVIATPLRRPGDENWDPRFSPPGVDLEIRAIAFGPGTTVYAGGDFDTAGLAAAYDVAMWDGAAWQPIGRAVSYPSGGHVGALAVSGDDLYVGGLFEEVYDSIGTAVSANYIARWDGHAWHPLGSGLDGEVKDILVHPSGTVYVAGDFATAGGSTAKGIAAWDGSSWSEVGGGVTSSGGPGSLRALALDGTGTLFAGGLFDTAGAGPANNIAAWNGSDWSALGSGVDSWVSDMSVSGDDLYVVGSFGQAGGSSAWNIARWDGAAWHGLANSVMNDTVYGTVRAVGATSTGVFVVGQFTRIVDPASTPVDVERIAYWNGSTWAPIGGIGPSPYAAEVDVGVLYVGGDFDWAGPIGAGGLALWDGVAWSNLAEANSGHGVSGQVFAAASDSLGQVYAGGYFEAAGGVRANHIARWDGTNWYDLDGGATVGDYSSYQSPRVDAIAVYTGGLYAAGDIKRIGGVDVNYVAHWDGANWSAVGAGPDDQVFAAAVDPSNGDLYVGGKFYNAGGITARYVAKWDGTTWSALGTGTNDWVSALAVDPLTGDLYAGGYFSQAGGAPASRIAKWDGVSWSPLGGGLSSYVHAIVVSGTQVYVGGEFSSAGGLTARAIARWDGANWHALGAGLTGGSPENAVRSLALGADGLYAGGAFGSAGTETAYGVARWDGSSWHGLGSGLVGAYGDSAQAITVVGQDLYAGGLFRRAGRQPSLMFGRWIGSAPDLVVELEDDPDPLFDGQTLIYTISVANHGSETATGVVLTDTLPATVLYGSVGASQGSCGHETGVVTCSLSSIAVGAEATVTILVTPTITTTLVNTATVTAAEGDRAPADNQATETTLVNPADLAVLKSDASDPVLVGDPLTYWITVTNAGPRPAPAVTLLDSLPMGMSLNSAEAGKGTCGESGGLVTCSLGTLAAGQQVTVSLVVTPMIAGTMRNEATVMAQAPDPDTADNAAQETTLVQGTADLSLVKVDLLDPVAAGSSVTYLLTAHNAGPDEAPNVSLTDTLPAGVAHASAAGTQGSCSHQSGVLGCDLGSLFPGGVATVTLVVTTTMSGAITNTAWLSSDAHDPNSGDDGAQEVTTVEPATDLALTKTAPGLALLGTPVTYTLRVTNQGPLAATGVVLTDTLPDGMIYRSAADCQHSAGTVTCDLGALGVDATVTATISAVPALTGTLVNLASVSSDLPDPASGNNTATAETLVTEDLLLYEDFDEGIPAAWTVEDGGDPGAAYWRTDNPGGRTIGAPFVDPWAIIDSDAQAGAADDSLVSPLVDASICTGLELSFANQFVWYSGAPNEIGDVDVSTDGGETWINVLRMQGGSDGYETPNIKQIDLTALAAGQALQIRFHYYDAYWEWWWAVDNVALRCQLPSADLAVAKTGQLEPVVLGADLAYTVTVTNLGPETATGVTAADTLPANTTLSWSAASQGTGCTGSAGALTCDLGDLAAGAVATVTLGVTTTEPGTLTNTVSVSADQRDPDLASNQAHATNSVLAAADLAVAKWDTPDPAMVDAPLTYTLVITNQGPWTATSVILTDTLPAQADLNSVPASCTEGVGSLVCDLGTLDKGEVVSLTLWMTPTSPTTLTNLVEVRAAEWDHNPADNAAVALTTVEPYVAYRAVFDGIPDGWTVVNGGGGVGASATWTTTNTCGRFFSAAYEDPWVMVDSDCAGPADQQDEQLISPLIDLTSCSGAGLIFGGQFHAYADEMGDVDISLDGGASWINLLRLQGSDAGYPVPETQVVDLTPLAAGHQFQLRFHYYEASYDWWWAVNGVEVVCGIPAGLAVSKTGSPDPAWVGQPLTYTLQVINHGPEDATNVQLTDFLPAGVELATVTADPPMVCEDLGAVIACSAPSLLHDDTLTVSITVTPTQPALLINEALVVADEFDVDPTDNWDTWETYVNPADLSLTKTDLYDSVALGSVLTYTLVVTNQGPAVAHSVTLTDSLPGGTTLEAVDGAGCSGSSGIITCTLGLLEVDQVRSLTLTVGSAVTGTLINSARVWAQEPDPTPADNTDQESTIVYEVADLQVTKNASADTALFGQLLTYTLVVTNVGPSVARHVLLTDTLPPAVTLNTAASSRGSCGPSGDLVICDLESIPVGDQVTVTITVTPTSPAAKLLVNRVVVTAEELDPEPSDNSDQVSTVLILPADLSVVKWDSADPIHIGQVLTYTLVVTNHGPFTATQATLTDRLPPSVTLTYAHATVGSCVEEPDNVVYCQLDDLSNGVVVTVTVGAVPTATGILLNSAEVDASSYDPDTLDNTAQEATEVVPAADLELVKTGPADGVRVGDRFTYTLRVANQGPLTATGVVLTDTLPPSVTLASAASPWGDCVESQGWVVCSLQDMTSGSAATVTLVVTATEVGLVTNRAEVQAQEHDPVLGSNLATAETAIRGSGYEIYLPAVMRQTASSSAAGRPRGR